MQKSAALVLAAGKGTRMHSEKPKVLQTVLGDPMLACVTAALRPVFADNIWIVVGHRADMVRAAFPQAQYVLQEQQLGTGHALLQSLPVLQEQGVSHVLVVNGDAPLLSEDAVRVFLSRAGAADLAFATIVLDDPAAYGRVVRKNGKVCGIVEARDYDEQAHGPFSGEVNAGIYWIALELAARLLPRIGNNNRNGEYYLTDIVGLAIDEKASVMGIECGRDDSLLGVNSPRELAHAEEILRARIVRDLMDAGVVLHAPQLVRVGSMARIDPGVELTGPCEIVGKSHVHQGASIASHCVVKDSEIGEQAEIRSFSHLDGANVGRGGLVGPFARLRPGAIMAEDAHVGNFVELKKTVLGRGAKANHLTYLGDAFIGEGANIGAGTITCNYDGEHKFQTHIGAFAFIGSNTALVAPVNVGAKALVGAGSVITRDVPENTLAIARERQKNLPRKIKD